MRASFGDHVRIASTPVTHQAGLAGLVGTVFGETRPSVSGVTVIGDANDDFALNVSFEGRKETYWLTLDLVEFVDHYPDATIRLEGVPKEWVREKTGEWRESDLPLPLWRRLLAKLGLG
jgi:hypothetical protein